MLTDVRHAIRGFRRSPGFTAAAVITLALGIGANTAVFSLIRAVFLRPLPFPEERLAMIVETRDSRRDARLPVSGHEYVAWKEQNRVFERVALFRGAAAHATGKTHAESIALLHVSADYFPVLGLEPAIGRVFSPGEDRAGFNRVILLSDAFWRRRFGGDPDVVGQPMMLDDQAFTIVGVLRPLPPSIGSDAWVPIDLPAHTRAVGRHNLHVIARLAPGVTIAQAQADVAAISARLERELPSGNTDHRATVVPLRHALVGEYRSALLALSAAVCLVLLIACANVANLLLTRGAGREKEFAIRTALGAARIRLVRYLLVEGVLLALLGGAAGLLLAAWIMDLAPRVSAVSIPLLETARLDRPALAAALALCLMTGMTAGLAPALRLSRTHGALLAAAGRTPEDPGRRRLRGLLVASEVALTLMLLVGAGLTIRSFIRLTSVDPGFQTERMLVVPVDLPGSRYPEASGRRAFVDELLQRLRALPGVSAAGATSQLPLGGADNWMMFTLVGRPEPPPGQAPNAAFRVVTPDYFRALGIPLRHGRFFSEDDARLALPLIRWFPQQPVPAGSERTQPPPVAIVSDTAARMFWPGEDALGQRIRVLFSPEVTIVGIVGDVRHTALHAPATPHVYLSHNQEPWSSLSVVVRTSVDPSVVAAGVHGEVRSLDDSLPVSLRTMDDVVGAAVGGPRFYVLLVTSFAVVAVGLAVVGLFGVVSYSAARRTREIGVRLALGAQHHQIVALIVGQSLRPVAAGLIVGTLGALAVTRFIETLLFEVRPTDPLTFSAGLVLLVAITLAASWIPARRAARQDPLTALRVE